MTVFDASVVVDAFAVGGPAGERARERLRSERELLAPSILRAEAVSALRRLVANGRLDGRRGTVAVEQVLALDVVEYPFGPFAWRAWQLRDSVSVYDAWYVALAEALGTVLVTGDRRLARAPGLACPVELLA
jgi:predicted nucleic acid-binding protein